MTDSYNLIYIYSVVLPIGVVTHYYSKSLGWMKSKMGFEKCVVIMSSALSETIPCLVLMEWNCGRFPY